MKDYGLIHYQNQSNVADVELLREDAINFSVLTSILQRECTDIFTNHESIIICYSCSPYPVWAWCKDVTVDADVHKIADCLKHTFPLEDAYTCNLSYELLERLKEVDSYFSQAEIEMNLLSYRLDELNEVNHPCDGAPEQASQDELELLAKLWHDACLEMLKMDHSEETCLKHVEITIAGGMLFIWRDSAGEVVAITSRKGTKGYSRIGTVYTKPDKRRCGYAINLVAHVTRTILAEGLTPILYTNADYAASNACYQKIGYKQVGSLCTIKKPTDEVFPDSIGDKVGKSTER